MNKGETQAGAVELDSGLRWWELLYTGRDSTYSNVNQGLSYGSRRLF